MANLMNAIVGACALACLVQAVPLRVLTVTDIVTVTTWETINSTSTVWAPANQSPTAITTSTLVPSSSSKSAVVVATTSAAAAVVAPPAPATPPPAAPSAAPAAAPAAPPAAGVGGQFAQAPAPLAASAFPSTTATIPVAQPAPAVPSTFTTSVYVPPQPTTTPLAISTTAVVAAPVPQTTAAAAASSHGGQCASGVPCTGDVTHWDGGLGACGWSVNTKSDMQIALPAGMMGSQSNGNPFCGRSVTLKNPTTGTTVQATVGDKCVGCTGTSIDCTDAVFNAITDGTGDGRVSGMEWWFN